MAAPPNGPPTDFQVGYGKPPSHSRFKPGQSGNPKGRPKGLPTASEIFMREASRLVRVQVGDRVETISKLEAVFRKLMGAALAGEHRAMGMVLAAQARFGAVVNEAAGEGPNEHVTDSVIPDDEALRRMMSRFDHLREQ